jgi:hypothetical protein
MTEDVLEKRLEETRSRTRVTGRTYTRLLTSQDWEVDGLVAGRLEDDPHLFHNVCEILATLRATGITELNLRFRRVQR